MLKIRREREGFMPKRRITLFSPLPFSCSGVILYTEKMVDYAICETIKEVRFCKAMKSRRRSPLFPAAHRPEAPTAHVVCHLSHPSFSSIG